MVKSAWELVGMMESDRVVERLLTDGEYRLCYLMDPPARTEPGTTILHVSCNTVSIPHIVYLTEKIFSAIGIQYIEIGGPENCCGAMQWLANDELRGNQVASMTLGSFGRVKPIRVVSTCPDCDLVFEIYKKKFHRFVTENVIQVIGSNIETLKPLMTKDVNKRVVLHYHNISKHRLDDKDALTRILRAIPGLTLLEASHSAGFGNHCMPRMGRIDNTLFGPEIKAMFEEAVELGADTLAVPYHGCYRNHVKREPEYGVEVVHYLELIAAAMGIKFEQRFKEIRFLNDVDAAVERLAPRGKELGYDMATIRKALLSKVYV